MKRVFRGVSQGLVFWAVFLLLRRWWRLRNIPGPFLAAITNLWRARIQWSNPIVPTLLKLHRQYGPIVRVGPNTVSVADPASVRSIYTQKGDFTKADTYGPMRIFVNGKSVGSMIDMQDEVQNFAIKRAVGGAFTVRNALDYERDADDTITELVQRITDVPSCNLQKVLQFYQLDFLSRAAFSENPGHLRDGQDVFGLAAIGDARLRHWFKWQPMHKLEHFIFHNPLWGHYFAAPSKWASMSRERLQQRTQNRAKFTGYTDLLQKYMEASDKHPDSIQPATIGNLVNSTIAAGRDTTAGTMTTMIYFLLKDPEKYRKLQAEIDEAMLKIGTAVIPRYTQVAGLPYLDAVIKEAMRLCPVLSVLMERVVPKGGVTIAGKFLPEGTVVGCSAPVVHRDSACFGERTDEFYPERWLTKDEARRNAMDRAFLSWGGGNRICLGRHIAEMEIKKVIPTLLSRFEIVLENPEVKLPLVAGLIELYPHPIQVTFKKRTIEKHDDSA